MRYYPLIAVLLFFSCKHGEKELPFTDLPIIDLTNVYNKEEKKLNLSEITSDLTYIQLETNNNSVLGPIADPGKDIKFYKDKILIKDKLNNLLLFDVNGNFLSKIAAVGKGPGEYLTIDGFTFCRDSNLIAVNSRHQHKINLYDYNGRYIKNFSTGFQTNDLYGFKNSLLSVNNVGFRRYSDFYNITLFSKNGEKQSQVLKRAGEEELFNIEQQKTKKAMIYWTYYPDARRYYHLKNIPYFWEYGRYNSRDTIWRITNNLELVPSFVFQFEGEKPPLASYYTKNRHLPEEMKEEIVDVKDFIDTEEYMFIETFKFPKLHRVLRNKEQNNNIPIPYQGFHNDLDGGLPFWPDGFISDNKIFKLLEVHKIKKFLKQNPNSFDENTNIADKEHFLTMMKDAELTNNPILMVIRLKN